MNAGTSLEGMIITSITNTFGGYYQTSKVKITLDGKPYESGHFLLKPDEFFTVDTENSYEYK
jgi:diadenosine tetraphosphate (Ap4A) HIT family hydrolase